MRYHQNKEKPLMLVYQYKTKYLYLIQLKILKKIKKVNPSRKKEKGTGINEPGKVHGYEKEKQKLKQKHGDKLKSKKDDSWKKGKDGWEILDDKRVEVAKTKPY